MPAAATTAAAVTSRFERFLNRSFADRYQITGLLGVGGMGAVFVAYDESLNREVAIKIILPEFATDPGLLRRLVAEATTTAKLRHAHIVTVYDCQQDESGTPFIVLERLHGWTLATQIEIARPSLGDSTRWIYAIVRAAAEAHSNGIIHRDIKPQNVFMELSRSERIPKLLDFGLAKPLNELISQSAATQKGAAVGSPAYMSPEQARGQKVGPSTDVWSIGMTWFFVLTGRLPWDSTDYPSTLLNIVQAAFPDVRSLSLDPIPEALCRVLYRALERDPSKRYPNANAMEHDVKALLDAGIGNLTSADRRARTAEEIRQFHEHWDNAASNPLLAGVAKARDVSIWLNAASAVRAPEAVIVAVQRAIMAGTSWTEPMPYRPVVEVYNPAVELIADLEAAGLKRSDPASEGNRGPTWEWRAAAR